MARLKCEICHRAGNERCKDLKISEKGLKESEINLMTTKFASYLLAIVFALPVATLAQADGSGTPLPAAPSAANSAAAAPATDPAAGAGGTRVGTINIEQAIFASNEGQRDFEALTKKLEPKQTELKNMNDE